MGGLMPASYDEDNWRAESDARALRDAEEVKADPGRHQRALDHVKRTSIRDRKILAAKKSDMSQADGFTRLEE